MTYGKKILNDYQILIQSSKACAGVPYSFMKNITLQDYKTALLQNYNESKTAIFNIIKNHKYVNKTISVTKKILNTSCVKRYMESEQKSFSFGYHKIPIDRRLNFISDSNATSDNENILERISISDDIISENENSNISISLSDWNPLIA